MTGMERHLAPGRAVPLPGTRQGMQVTGVATTGVPSPAPAATAAGAAATSTPAGTGGEGFACGDTTDG
jgi:hypothetical protein